MTMTARPLLLAVGFVLLATALRADEPLSLRDAAIAGTLPPALAVTRDDGGLTLKNSGAAALPVTATLAAPLPVARLDGTVCLTARTGIEAGFALVARDASGAVHHYPLRAERRDPRGFRGFAAFRLDRAPNEGFAEGTAFFVGPAVPGPLQVTGIEAKLPPGGEATLAALAVDPVPRRLGAPRWTVVNAPAPDDNGWFVSGKAYRDFGGEGAPRLAAAALVPGPGRYEIGLTVRDAWQGPVAAERRVVVDVSADDWKWFPGPSVPLPIAGTGTRWVEARAWDAATHRPAGRGDFLAFTDIDAPPPPPAEGGPARLLSWSAPGGGAFEEGAKAEIVLTAAVPGRLDAVLRGLDGETVAEEHADLQAGASFTFSGLPAAPGAWFLDARLSDGQGPLDACLLRVGRKGAPVVAAPAADLAPYPQGVVASEFLLPVRLKGATPDIRLRRLERGLRAAVDHGLPVVELEFPWNDLEPLPGVYDFAFLDKCLDLVGRAGLTANLSVWYLADHRPSWLASEVDRDAEGGWCEDHLCVSSPRLRASFAGLWKTIAERYRGDRRVSGYLVTNPGLDWGIADNWPWPHREYAAAAQAAFRDYLRADRALDLAAVAARYGLPRPPSDWSEVVPPVAQYGSPADLRPAWRDYLDFRVHEMGTWFDGVLGTIRKADAARPIWVYQYHGVGPHEAYFPLYQKYQARPTTGAVEEGHYQNFVSRYSLWGLSSRGEPNPAQGTRNVDLGSGFFALLSGGPLAANYSVEWHGAYPDQWDAYDTLPSAERALLDPGWMERVRKNDLYGPLRHWAALLPRLAGARLPENRPAVLFSDAVGLYRERSFTTYQAMGGILSHYWNDIEHLTPQWISDDTPLPFYRNVPCVIVDSAATCLRVAAVKRLGDYARGGGLVVTTPLAGRWLDDREGETGTFLAELGFPGPDRLAPEAAGPGGAVSLGTASLAFSRRCRMPLPPDAETVASFPDGSPAAALRKTGAGAVLLLLGDIDWGASRGFAAYLATLRPLDRWADASSPKIRIVALQQNAVRWIFAAYYLPLPQRDREGADQESFQLLAPGLPPGTYRVTDALAERDYGPRTAAELAQGLPVTLSAGDSAFFRIEPAPESGK